MKTEDTKMILARVGETMNLAPKMLTAKAQTNDDGTVVVKGLLYSGDAISVGGYGRVALDLKGATSCRVPLVANHSADLEDRIGDAELTVTDDGIYIEAWLVPGISERVTRAMELAMAGSLSFSLGAVPLRTERVSEGERKVNGRMIAAPFLHVLELDLREASLVAIPADPKSHQRIAAQAPSGEGQSRVSTIMARFSQYGEDGIRDAEKAIAEGWDDAKVDAAETNLWKLTNMRTSRTPPVGGGRRADGPGITHTDVPLAAILIKAGYGHLAERLGAKTCEHAEKLTAHALDIFKAVLGPSAPTNRNDLIRASFSTNAVSGIVRAAGERIALDAVQKSPEAWLRFAHRVNLADFKENKLTRIAGRFRFEKVGRDGDLKHVSIDADQTPIKLGTAGAIAKLDRQMLIDDDLETPMKIVAELATEWARGIGDDLAALIDEASPVFFTTGRNNLYSGGASALGVDSIGEVIKRGRQMTDSTGRFLNLPPAFLRVGADLELRAKQLMNSAEIRSNVEDAVTAIGNPVQGVAEVLVDPRVPAGEWQMFSLPSNAAAVVGTLNGTMAPVIETLDLPIENLGIGIRAYGDWGVALHEWRAAIRSLGA